MATTATQLERAPVEEQVLDIVRQLLAELGATQAVASLRAASRLEQDLSLGSLERVELLLRVSKTFRLHLADQVVAEADTVEDLVRAVMDAAAMGAVVEGEIFSSQLAQVRRHPEDSVRPRATSRRSALQAPADADTLNEVLEYHARTHPDRPQVYLREDPVDGRGPAHNYVLTYSDLHAGALAVSNGLLARGLGPRQSVAIMLPTSREFFFTFYGVLLAGGVPVPIYPPFRADRIEEYASRQSAILRNAEARQLVTFRQTETVARLLKPRVPTLESVTNAAKLMDSPGTRASAERYHPRYDDLAFLQYTSGSTGDPKGVMLTHANLLANIRAIVEALDVNADDVGTSWLPLYHDMGLIGAWLMLLYAGIPLASMSPLAFLAHPERWLWAVHHHRGTLAAAPNFAYELCVKKIAAEDIEGLDLSSWRAALNGAEPVNAETIGRFAERFSRYRFRPEAMLPVYGLAEASLAVTVPPLGRPPRVDRIDRSAFVAEGRAIEVVSGQQPESEVLGFVSCGRAIPRHEVRIADSQGNDSGVRVEGQLWFRGPSATQGYIRNPAATANILRADGWVDSGDRAYQAGGEIFITGRVKDIIIKAGRNIYPHEVEEIAGGVAGVRVGCVAAFGVSDPGSGTERLVIVAETRERDVAARREIAHQVTARVAEGAGMPPDVVEMVPPGAIPKTSSGKLRRNDTKRLYQEGKLSRRKPPAWLQVAKLGATSGARQAARVAVSGTRGAIDLVFGVYAVLLFVLFLVPTWGIVLCTRSRTTARRITSAALRRYFRLIGCPIRADGLEHLRAAETRIFVSNHSSYADVLILLAALPVDFRFIAKMEVRAMPFIRAFIQKMGHFAFDRGDRRARLDQVSQMEEALRQGDSVFVFPEGTFTPHPGVRAFQLGAFKAALTTGVPIYPVAVSGARELLRDETWLPRPSAGVTLTVLPPIEAVADPDAPPESTGWNEIVRLRDATRSAIAPHAGEPLL